MDFDFLKFLSAELIVKLAHICVELLITGSAEHARDVLHSLFVILGFPLFQLQLMIAEYDVNLLVNRKQVHYF